MGLFDSIRRVVGGATTESDDATTQPALVDTHDLDVSALRERAAGVAGEVAVLDFSLDSLAQFDDAIDNGYDEDLATADVSGTYATDTVRFGCYLGEVLVRAHGGEWTHDPEWGVTISGPDGTTTVAVLDVAERSITTGAVFAAVADQAAAEVGLDGVPTDERDTETTGGDDPKAAAASDATPPTERSSDDDSMGETPSAADREAVDHVVDDADTGSLIEEAEPEAAAGDTAWAGPSEPSEESVTGDDATEPAPRPRDAPATADASPPLFEAGTDSADQDASPSLFDETPTGTGPTVDDTASADDGLPVGASGPESDSAPAGEPDHDIAGPGETDSDGQDTATPDPTAGDGIRATYAETAEELASFWTEYDLDYTAASLERLDTLVSEEWDDDRFDDAEFGSDDTFDDRAFSSVSTELGSYFGEVLVRALDAEWSDETATDAVVVEAADGPLAIPVFKVAGTSIKQQPVFARSYDSLLSDLESDA